MGTALLEPQEHVLSTLEKDGSRRWLRPTLSMGRYWRIRRIVGYALIALFVALPHLRVGGKPAVLLDVVQRKFFLFGYTFLPTDTLLLALLLVGVFLTIFLLTALLGRVWCGWACPQTVYLEFVFRPIERLFDGTMGTGGRPPQRTAGWRRGLKYAVYFALAVALAHTFLSYFVGVERLARWVRQSPFEHPGPFLVMAGTTLLMMFDFCYFREQLCLIACPYGRFQSVLLDRQSLIVAYDKRRGEPRRKISKSLPIASEASAGDCVDCGACVRTCPTGIDVRNGLQMECVHCTQCIDACDAIMERLDRPTGLIRYSRQSEIEGAPGRRLRPRLVLYPAALLVVAAAFAYALATRQAFDATLLRSAGLPFSVAADGAIQNSMRVKLVNRVDRPLAFEFRILDREDVSLDAPGDRTTAPAGATTIQPLLFTAPRSQFQRGELDVRLSIRTDDGEERIVRCRLLGPG